jgi:hypothetical protein
VGYSRHARIVFLTVVVVAFAVDFAFFVVIPEGDLLLPCPVFRPNLCKLAKARPQIMNEAIPQLHTFDEPSLDKAFATLAEEVSTETASLQDVEAFRLHWLGRKQGRLKLHQRGLA